ncbi:MAG TPA: hypothetical protein VJZ91_13105 [Blastocatellia bacterium]|nr:hypothetical protein [Blastocatellia bacterium]
MSMLNQTRLLVSVAVIGCLALTAAAQSSRLKSSAHGAGPAGTAAAVKNTWRGLTPLQSSAEAAAQVVGTNTDLSQAPVGGPYRVEGGEVTFSFLTPSLAKMYRAPRALAGKIFTIYFTPQERIARADLKLGAGFKVCKEEMSRTYYYLVNDIGVAYRLRRSDDTVETIIYQPSRAEVRRLAVNTECVF